jgi:hypothetical protein
MYPLATHCRFCWEKPRLCWIDGSATLTIAVSAMSRNCTAHNSTNVMAPSLERRTSSEVASLATCPCTDPIAQPLD